MNSRMVQWPNPLHFKHEVQGFDPRTYSLAWSFLICCHSNCHMSAFLLLDLLFFSIYFFALSEINKKATTFCWTMSKSKQRLKQTISTLFCGNFVDLDTVFLIVGT